MDLPLSAARSPTCRGVLAPVPGSPSKAVDPFGQGIAAAPGALSGPAPFPALVCGAHTLPPRSRHRPSDAADTPTGPKPPQSADPPPCNGLSRPARDQRHVPSVAKAARPPPPRPGDTAGPGNPASPTSHAGKVEYGTRDPGSSRGAIPISVLTAKVSMVSPRPSYAAPRARGSIEAVSIPLDCLWIRDSRAGAN